MRFCKQGDRVKSGDVLVKVDLDYVKSAGKKTVSPVIFTSGEKDYTSEEGHGIKGRKIRESELRRRKLSY